MAVTITVSAFFTVSELTAIRTFKGGGIEPMNDKHWNDLAQLGQKMSQLSELLERANGYGDDQEAQRLDAEMASIQDARDKIIVTIAELSVAP